jgi:hypothetical protein
MTEPHRFAKIFPPLTEAELLALADDMKVSGQRERITLYEGKILDGVNREAACESLGLSQSMRTTRAIPPFN